MSATRPHKTAGDAVRKPPARRHQEAPGADVQRVLQESGTPLPPAIRRHVEARFGQDFTDVRIHADQGAAQSAAAQAAKAYTVGRHIVFGAGRFSPQDREGQRLLAHELAHVVQQRRGGAAPALSPNAPNEQAADAAARAVAAGQGPVAVSGATGVGMARDEDESWGAKLRRKYSKAKEAIPPEYRDKMQKAADFAADKAVDAVALPLGPVGAYATDGLGSSLLHAAQKTAAGEEGATDDLKNFGRDKVQESLGAVKGVVTQLTEVADTGMWVGNEYKDLRDSAAKKIGGKEGSFGNTAVKNLIDGTARLLPGTAALPGLADASDAVKSAGLIDEDTKQASLTASLSRKLNEYAKSAEAALGATPREPEMFSPMEKAELATNIGTQVALAFTGAEEVKVVMNVVGAISGLRGIVESIRHEPDWATSSRFWGSLIGMALSIVGLKHTMAASKITTLLLKFGWVAAAVPPLAQMAADYVNPNLSEEEREKRVKQGFTAAIHVLKDAILHIAQSQGGNTARKPGADAGGEGAPGGQRSTRTNEPVPETLTKPAAGASIDAPAVTPAAQPATPIVVAGQPSTASPPAVTPPSAATNVKPLRGTSTPAKSAASQRLDAQLAKQSPDRAGSVTPMRPRRTSKQELPKSNSDRQPVRAEAPVEQKLAVGQTHGPEPTRPTLVDVSAPKGENSVPTVMASSGKRSGSSPSQPGASSTAGGSRPTRATGAGARADRPSRNSTPAAKRQNSAGPSAGKPAPPARNAVGPARRKGSTPPGKSGSGPKVDNDPLVIVKIRGKNKGEFWPEGSPQFKSNAGSSKSSPNRDYVVLPEGQAKDLKFRPHGTKPDTSIKPRMRAGKPMESLGAGRTAAGREPAPGNTPKSPAHPITARATRESASKGKQRSSDLEMPKKDPAAAHGFERTIRADVNQAQGYNKLLDQGEFGLLRPGNISTGGVDAITVRIDANGKAKIFLNDFTSPGAPKPPKATHANWRGELKNLIDGGRVQFADKKISAAIKQAFADNEVYVRPVRVQIPETAGTGPRLKAGTAEANISFGKLTRVEP